MVVHVAFEEVKDVEEVEEVEEKYRSQRRN